MKKSLAILGLMVCCTLGFTPPQSRTITGVVTAYSDGSKMPGVNVTVKGTKNSTATNAAGRYSITTATNGGTLVFSFVGYITKEVKLGTSNVIDVTLEDDVQALTEVVITGYSTHRREKKDHAGAYKSIIHAPAYESEQQPHWNTEEYDAIEENIFREATKNPLSTFSIDVDAAS